MTLPLSSSNGLYQQVYKTLGDYLRRDSSTLHPKDSLRDDLGLDSLQTIELVYQVESTFDLQIPDEDFGRLQTIGDVVAYLDEKLGTPQTKDKTMNAKAAPSSTSTSRSKSSRS